MDKVFEMLCVNRELHSALFVPVCAKYHLTHTEMMVLLHLKEKTEGDTAADIVKRLKLAKSHVSASVRDLVERGLVKGSYEGGNHRSIHLQLCESAKPIVMEGEKVQRNFSAIIEAGFTQEEKKIFREYLYRMAENANTYLKNHN